METFLSWAGGAALIGLAWLLKTIYRRHQEGKPPLVDPENKVPALDIPRDIIIGLIDEWYAQKGAANIDERLTNHANRIAEDLQAHTAAVNANLEANEAQSAKHYDKVVERLRAHKADIDAHVQQHTEDMAAHLNSMREHQESMDALKAEAAKPKRKR